MKKRALVARIADLELRLEITEARLARAREHVTSRPFGLTTTSTVTCTCGESRSAHYDVACPIHDVHTTHTVGGDA